MTGSGSGSDDLDDDLFSSELVTALLDFTGCVGEAPGNICSYSLTIGENYVPFLPDDEDEDECDEGTCSQVWVRVTDIQPKQSSVEGWTGDCAETLVYFLEVGVIRCIEIPEGGEAPTATDVLSGALQSMEDMKRIHCAATSCDVWGVFNTGIWNPLGPLGGQFGGIWTFSAEL